MPRPSTEGTSGRLWGIITISLLIAFGSIVGGQIGSRVGRRLPPPALRTIIICVGIAAEAKLMMG